MTTDKGLVFDTYHPGGNDSSHDGHSAVGDAPESYLVSYPRIMEWYINDGRLLSPRQYEGTVKRDYGGAAN